MFTGIIQATGRISRLQNQAKGAQITIVSEDLDLSQTRLGDSIAVSGVCLTVITMGVHQFSADVSAETLSRTSIGTLNNGDNVNLEKALTLSTPLGGHLVSGHVDGVGEIVERTELGEAIRFWVKAPDNLAKYIAEKGSITIDGISLTVNEIDGAKFQLTIVPHTLEVTTMKQFAPGRLVNIEVDLIARYLERLLLGESAAQSNSQGISKAFLAQHGFIPGT